MAYYEVTPPLSVYTYTINNESLAWLKFEKFGKFVSNNNYLLMFWINLSNFMPQSSWLSSFAKL